MTPSSSHLNHKRRQRNDRWARRLIQLGGIGVLFTFVGLIAYMLIVIFPLFASPQFSFSQFWLWSEAKSNELSVIPTLFGTLKAAVAAMLFAIPLAVGSAIYTGYFMAKSMRRFVKPAIEMIEALPTVIIGFIAALWLAPWLDKHLFSVVIFFALLALLIFGLAMVLSRYAQVKLRKVRGWMGLIFIPILILLAWAALTHSDSLEAYFFADGIHYWLADKGFHSSQRNALIVGIAMGFAVIPTIFTLAEEAIFAVPKHLSDGASALGATRWQCFTSIVLVTAMPGIIAAIMVGIGRAIGETMIVLMATGNTPLMDWNLLEGMRTLTADIAMEMPESKTNSLDFRLLFLSAFLLLLLTFIFNSIAEWIRQRLRVKYHGL